MVRNPRWTLTQEATLALAISAAFPASAFAAEVARVQFAAGQASATTADGRVRTLARGADINEGDTVNTEQGRVQLKFRDGALVSLQPRTAFRIDEYAFRGTADGSEKGFFSLLRGGLRTITGVIGRSNNDSYRVRTQTATIGIRGTEYIAQVGNSLNVSVGGGRIALTNDAGTFIIEQGQSAYVADSKSLPIVQLQKPVLSPQGTNEGTQAPEPKREVVAGEGSNATLPGESTTPPVEPPVPSMHIGAFVWDGGANVNASTGNATLSGNQLTHFTDPASGTVYDKGTTTVHDASFDNTIGVARWSNGTFSVTPGGSAAQQVTVGANQGFHAVFGTPTPTMPTSAVATYGLMAATQATSSDGSLSLGTVAAAQGVGQPILAVDFASGRVGTDFTVSFTDRAYRVTSTGGIFNVSDSEIRLLGANAPGVFANVLSVPTSGLSGNACIDDSCTSTDVLGFFAGDNASRAGFTYRITDDTLKVNGAVAAGPAVTGSALTTSVNPMSAAFAGPHDEAFIETFVGTGSGSLDTSNRLTAFTGTNDVYSNGTIAYSMGTATFAQSGYDGVIGFGRLANGTTSLDGGEGAGPIALSNGLHVAFGAPTASTQIAALVSGGTPTVTYSLLGATGATATHLPGLGTVSAAQGGGQPILSVDFSSGRVGVDFNVNFASAGWGYRVTSTGGIYNVSSSQIIMVDAQNSASFAGFSVPTTSIAGEACTGSGGCSTNIRGFFAGTDAARAGFSYRIRDSFEVEVEFPDTGYAYGAVTATAATPRAALLAPSTAIAVVSGNGNDGNTFAPDIFGAEGTASLNASGHMINFSGFNVVCCGSATTAQGTATLAEAGYDGIVGYGRFSNGSVTVDGAEGAGAGTTHLSSSQGLHYAFGSQLASLPSTPVIAQYSLLGATKATADDGSLGLGTLSGALAVDFHTRKVGLDLSVAFTDPSSTRYHMMTTGGTSSVLTSEISVSNNPAFFDGSVPVVRSLSGSPEIACASGCSAFVRGFFSGSSAERAGLGYRIFDSDTGNGISGAGTFAQTSTVPLLTGTGIALNFAGAIDHAPPVNNSDAFKHLGTTGTIDGTNALAAINAGGNTTIGTATVNETARDDVIGWARWSSGTLGGAGTYSNSVLSGHLSFHGVYGTPTSASDMAALQTAFVGLGATYTLIGGTAPTDATGTGAPGFLNSGSLTAWFGSQTVDVNLGVTAASRTFSVAATNLPISGSGFGGTTSNVSASGCSACTANIQGFFAGSMASRAGVSYSIKDFGSPLVNGAAGFTRTGTVTQPDS